MTEDKQRDQEAQEVPGCSRSVQRRLRIQTRGLTGLCDRPKSGDDLGLAGPAPAGPEVMEPTP